MITNSKNFEKLKKLMPIYIVSNAKTDFRKSVL